MIGGRRFAMQTAMVVGSLAVAALLASGPVQAGNTKPTKLEAPAPDAPLRLLISREEQRVDVYRGYELIASSPVSTGKRGYETPIGIYSILGKRRWHRSNIYSRAPMPFMQRITWSGIALHAGRVPGYPASHGCIRLPKEFAAELFAMTKVGADVIITASPAEPRPMSHPTLFQPSRPAFATASHDDDDAPTPTAGGGLAEVEYAVYRMQPIQERSTSPLRILITRRTGRQRMMDIQRMLRDLGHDPGEIDGYLGRNTGGAIQSFQRASGVPATGMVTDALVAALYEAVGREEIKGHIYVRQDYKDVFDAPVAISDIDTPLGTHVYSAGTFKDGAERARWSALTVNGDTATTPAGALDRIRIPPLIAKRISERLTPGSSLIISDAGFGKETGKGTDFIVQPR